MSFENTEKTASKEESKSQSGSDNNNELQETIIVVHTEENKSSGKVNESFDNFLEEIKKSLDQVERGKNGSTLMYELINKHVPVISLNVCSSENADKKEAKIKKVKIDPTWISARIGRYYGSKSKKGSMVDNGFGKGFVLGATAGKKSAKLDKQFNHFNGNMSPNYQPDRLTGYCWPCTAVDNQNVPTKHSALENTGYCIGYMLMYHIEFYAEKLKFDQQRSQWRNVTKKEANPLTNCVDSIKTFAPRWPSFNQLALSAKFFMNFVANNIEHFADYTGGVNLAGNITVLASLGMSATFGLVGTIKASCDLKDKINNHKQIEQYNDKFKETLSLRDTCCSKSTRAMLEILNSGGKVLLNGAAYGFYLYAAFCADNKLMTLISINSIIGINVVGDVGHALKDTVNICIDNEANDSSKQIASLQHCCTFSAKPVVSTITDGGSIVLMTLNYFGFVSDTVAEIGVTALQLFKTGFNYFANILGNRAEYRNNSNEIVEVDDDGKQKQETDDIEMSINANGRKKTPNVGSNHDETSPLLHT